MRSDVAILGCGPSGLLAAVAAEHQGYNPHIYSKKQPSMITGAQFIHEPIPLLHDDERPDSFVYMLKSTHGDARTYAAKVYGNANAPCSYDKFHTGAIPVWSMIDTYEKLWQYYENNIHDAMVDRYVLDELLLNYRTVISTIPPMHYCCDNHHKFPFQRVHFVKEFRSLVGGNVIMYNANPAVTWYRTSSLWGHQQTEYSAATVRNPEQIFNGKEYVSGNKPLTTDCDCYPSVVRVGRFGKWQKGILVHHAYKEAFDALH